MLMIKGTIMMYGTGQMRKNITVKFIIKKDAIYYKNLKLRIKETMDIMHAFFFASVRFSAGKMHLMSVSP